MTSTPSDNPSTDASDVDREADAELAAFGYAPQLKRSMGAFSSFALSFSLISITTGIFANYDMGLKSVGPVLLWMWALCVVGQTLVALVLADLSTRFPISGYGYQWTSRLAGPHAGFFAGWLLLAGFLFGFPAICATIAVYAKAYLGASWPAGLLPSWITIGVIVAMMLIHLFGIRLAAFVNDIGVSTEILGTTFVVLVLLVGYSWQQPAGPQVFFQSPEGGLTILALAKSVLVGAWCLTGFEAAADLAEETQDPHRTIPRAILLSVLSSGVGGFLMIGSFILASPNIEADRALSEPLMSLLSLRLGRVVLPFMIVVWISVFACGMASLASATRLVFAMARDNMLPFSSVLKRVSSEHKTPTNAILLVGAVAIVVVWLLEDLTVLSSAATVIFYVGYLAMVCCAFYAPLLGGKAKGFTLGKWAKPTCFLASIWTLFVVFALIGSDGSAYRLMTWSSLGLIMVGPVLYIFVRPRILKGDAGPPRSPST